MRVQRIHALLQDIDLSLENSSSDRIEEKFLSGVILSNISDRDRWNLLIQGRSTPRHFYMSCAICSFLMHFSVYLDSKKNEDKYMLQGLNENDHGVEKQFKTLNAICRRS